MPSLSTHRWKFNRIGGLDQVRFESGEDLIHLDELDPKLWVVLSCPTKGLEFDARTLTYLDTDQDGHIRVPEVIAAVKWAAAQLNDPGELLHPKDDLPLASINVSTETGRTLLASASQILRNLGKPDAAQIGLADTGDGPRIFKGTQFNGDGVITVLTADDPDLKKVIDEIGAVAGTVPDRTGLAGIDQAKADLFFAALLDFRDWRNAEENCLPPEAREKPFPAGSHAAFVAFQALQPKLDDYFLRCRLAAFDAKAATELTPSAATFAALALKNLAQAEELAQLPLQTIGASRPLDLNAGANPAFAAALEAFREQVVVPLLGAETKHLDDAGWRRIAATFSGYTAWVAGKKGAVAEPLGIDRVRAILADNVRNKINALIEEDLKLSGEANNIDAVDKLVRYYRNLAHLLRNFVNFEMFYDTRTPAIFQLGTMYLDQRSFRLCVRVEDPGAHAAVATASKAYLMYCACSRASGEKMNLAVGITQGDAYYVAVGRNGVFYDFQGRDWDATVVKVVENPISVQQAFWSPYRRLTQFIEEQIQKFASSKDQQIVSDVAKTAQDATTATAIPGGAAAGAAGAAPKPGTPAFDIARFAGIFAAIGLAIGAIGGAIGAMLSAFFSLAWWQMPVAVVGILLVISGPSVLMAWFNLRKRILGPILEANGWAINGRVRINIPLGNSMTRLKELPPGTISSRRDPFADKVARRRTILFAILVVVAIGAAVDYFFLIKPWLTMKAKYDSPPAKIVQRAAAPAPKKP